MAGGTYEALFGHILADVETEMQAVRAEQLPVAPILWEIIDFQFGWDLDDPAQARQVQGKKIRPLLMALVAQAISGSYHHVLPAGAALELLHNFTLIHDDVMDRSLERRHRPAVWTRWGDAQAINAGDGLFALAILAVGRLARRGVAAEKVTAVFESLSRAALLTAEGQILDMDFETRPAVTPTDYLTMITHKSAVLIECAAVIGALLSTDDPAVIRAYADFARSLGVAFQIRDDYLGVWGDENQTGKPATSDLRQKKKSYPVLVAFEQAVPADRLALEQCYRQDALSETDIQTVLGILDRVGAAGWTERVAEEHYQVAMSHLAHTGIENHAQDLIRQYAAFLVRRAY